MTIPFNKPHLAGRELEYIQQAVVDLKLSGNGRFTRLCQDFFQERYGFAKTLLTTSCTDALEMAALLLDIGPGDEVIVPSYTFVSTANAFVLRGAKIIFADSRADHPGIDENQIEPLISPRTKAIVAVHYAGVACDMDKIMEIAGKYNLFVVEDAAQAIDSYYKGKALGGIGHLAAFSFHETKNIISGEGGMLVINDPQFVKRAEIIWEKGTNRSAFFKGEVDKYGWVDIGSSFLPSELIAAFLYAQLEKLDVIQKRRLEIWNKYFEAFRSLEKRNLVTLQALPSYATNNGHLFYILVKDVARRDKVLQSLKKKDIHAVFHYISLHRSSFYEGIHGNRPLAACDRYTDTLIRLPLYFSLSSSDQDRVIDEVSNLMYE